MRSGTLQRILLLWIGLFALAFANGALRELLIKRFVEEPWAHHLSALTAIVFFSGYVFRLWPKTKISSLRQALITGVFWFVLTVVTETFLLNRWIAGLTWEEIIQTYNVASGELWPLVLIWVGMLPPVAYAMKGAAP